MRLVLVVLMVMSVVSSFIAAYWLGLAVISWKIYVNDKWTCVFTHYYLSLRNYG